jgi:hypothetical protein
VLRVYDRGYDTRTSRDLWKNGNFGRCYSSARQIAISAAIIW